MDPVLADFKRDVLLAVIKYRPSVLESIDKVFGAEVVWVDEAAAAACNADHTARCVLRRSWWRFIGCIANSRFRLGTGWKISNRIVSNAPWLVGLALLIGLDLLLCPS